MTRINKDREGRDTYHITDSQVSFGDKAQHAGRDINRTTLEPEKETKPWYKKIWAWFTGAIILLAAIVAILASVIDFVTKPKDNQLVVRQVETPKTENKITTEAKTSGDSSPIVGGDYVAGNKTVNIIIADPTLEAEVKRIAEKESDELTKKYPGGSVVFGVTQKGFIVPKGLVLPTSEIQWDTAELLEFTEKSIKVLLPRMIINTESVKRTQIAGVTVTLPKKVNAKQNLIGWPEIRMQVEIIGLHNEMVTIGVGFIPINNDDNSNTTKQ